jgi:hypothetical protein
MVIPPCGVLLFSFHQFVANYPIHWYYRSIGNHREEYQNHAEILPDAQNCNTTHCGKLIHPITLRR